MSRVAVVTGGTRGIGAAISKALKSAGYKVGANYAGNDEAAQKFKAKAGELGFTKALAQESARAGITVNAVCPGYINTEMVQAVPTDVLEKSILPLIPIGRLGEPEEIARCVVFLASDEAGLITGSTI